MAIKAKPKKTPKSGAKKRAVAKATAAPAVSVPRYVAKSDKKHARTTACCVWNELEAKMAASPHTVAQAVALSKRMVARLGYGVNTGRYEIAGVSANAKNGSDHEANVKLGKQIADKHAGKTVRVVADFATRSIKA